jgi:hypothetical protein
MIDIRELNNKTFDVTLQNGTILNLRKPSNELFKQTFTMIKLIEANSEEDKIIGAIYNFLTKIFNRNLNDAKFSQQQIEEIIDIDVAMYLIKEYQNFINEVMQDINF